MLLCPLRKRGGILLCTIMSVRRSVDRSVRRQLVWSVTKEFIAQGSYNLVWSLVITSRWPLLNFGFQGQRSVSQWHISLGGHTCFIQIIQSCFSKYLVLVTQLPHLCEKKTTKWEVTHTIVLIYEAEVVSPYNCVKKKMSLLKFVFCQYISKCITSEL